MQFFHFFDLQIFGFELLLKFFNFESKLIDLLLAFNILLWLINIVVLLLGNVSQPGHFLLLFISEFLGSASHVMPFLDSKKMLSHAQVVLEIVVIHVLFQGERFIMLIHLAGLIVTDLLRLTDL